MHLYDELPELRPIREFQVPSRYRHALTHLIQGRALTVDTRRSRSGWYETRVLDGHHLLALERNSVWSKAQVAHRIAVHAWECAQQWVCRGCCNASWALPGLTPVCRTHACPGGELCAMCTPLQGCELHDAH